MEIENGNIDFYLKKPEEYINKINELNGGVNLLLDEFKRIYIIAKMHPNNEDVQQRYQNMITNINQLQSKLFSMSNNVQVNIDDMNKELLKIDLLIRMEREKNDGLKRKLGMLEDKNNSSSEMISDFNFIYNMNYLRNWGLFLSTFVCLFAINSVYKKQGV